MSRKRRKFPTCYAKKDVQIAHGAAVSKSCDELVGPNPRFVCTVTVIVNRDRFGEWLIICGLCGAKPLQVLSHLAHL